MLQHGWTSCIGSYAVRAVVKVNVANQLSLRSITEGDISVICARYQENHRPSFEASITVRRGGCEWTSALYSTSLFPSLGPSLTHTTFLHDVPSLSIRATNRLVTYFPMQSTPVPHHFIQGPNSRAGARCTHEPR